jgi:hypothetical protein
VATLRRDERLEEVCSGFQGLEELEKLFTACRELSSWLEDKGFDVEGILEEGEELLDNALWLYWLLRDVLADTCKLADTWRGKQESACEDLEAMYFECAHRDAEGRVERWRLVVAAFGVHVFVAESTERIHTKENTTINAMVP